MMIIEYFISSLCWYLLRTSQNSDADIMRIVFMYVYQCYRNSRRTDDTYGNPLLLDPLTQEGRILAVPSTVLGGRFGEHCGLL